MITRYEEANAAVLNRELHRLQARYETVGNAIELIGSGTLTANQSSVDMPLNGISWRWLRLHAVMQLNKNVFAGLRANSDASGRYHSVYIDPAPVASYGSNESAIQGLFGDTGDVGLFDAWMGLNPLGFSLNGHGTVWVGSGWTFDVPTQEWNWAAKDLYDYKYAGVYVGGAVTSLQLVVPSEQDRTPLPADPRFETGGYWRLTGIRA